MATLALDTATITKALAALEEMELAPCTWTPTNPAQEQFLTWYYSNRKAISQLNHLEALVSDSYTVLNSYLEELGFVGMFEPFDGLGVASVLDLLLEWVEEGSVTTFKRTTGDDGVIDEASYPAFKLEARGVRFYEVVGHRYPLASLQTKSGDCLWLAIAHNQPDDGMDLFHTAQRILSAPRAPISTLDGGTIIPMLEIDIEPDISWMKGLFTDNSRDGYHQIVQAFQQFKLRANEKGARVKVATGLGTARGGALPKQPFIFNRPFIGFFTQADDPTIPMAAFYADTDSWRQPSGTLEEL
jgi:hypothetical protein